MIIKLSNNTIEAYKEKFGIHGFIRCLFTIKYIDFSFSWPSTVSKMHSLGSEVMRLQILSLEAVILEAINLVMALPCRHFNENDIDCVV